MTTTRTWRIKPVFIALLTGAMLATSLAAGAVDANEGEGEALLLDPEPVRMVTVEVDDPAQLDALRDRGIDLDHAVEPLDDGGVQAVAYAGQSEIDQFASLGVRVVSTVDLPTQEEVAAQRMGNVDADEVLARTRGNRGVGRGAPSQGREPVVDEAGVLRVLRADTFTNYAGDFLSVEARVADWTDSPNTLTVDAPSSAAGTYTVTGSAFGPVAPSTGVAGDLALVDDGTALPTEGCDPLVDFPAGAVALVDRGTCPFTVKVANAQAAGAVAVIVANNDGGAPFDLGGSDGSITIPSGMVSQADGQTLRDGLPATVVFRSPDQVVLSYELDGTTYSDTLSPFVDAGQYIYHRTPRSQLVPGIVDEVTVTYGEDEVTVPTAPWASYDETGYPDGFQWGFINTGYPDAVDSTNKIEELAAEFPEIAEIIELPYETHGYRRQAMLLAGNFTNTVVNLRSNAYGHEGGNDVTYTAVTADAPDAPLAVSVDGDDITVQLATDGDGAAVSTAAEVVEAINADPDASALVRAFTYRGNAGAGIAQEWSAGLSDFLSAPEDKISREPATVKAIRIGTHRDGSRTGVFAYSQEHAREWVTPVVALEAAERLVRNYGTDPDTTRFVDELDIFIIPSVNPDGANYSLYDNAFQRRNLNNYCDDTNNDALRRNSWGVDLNRNFRVGTIHDGYDGASASCVSDVFAGPEPLSEAESKNEAWLVENNPNIRFSMNIHTHGGYFMWAPGAYKADGRVPLERPSVGVEEYFFEASDTILSRIAEHRGTVVEPGRTGPTIDVLYSAAGNSADDVWYRSIERGTPIFAWNFEAGANRYTGGGASGWESINSFFPPFAEEGFDQGMEFASGIYGLLEVAADFQEDDVAPTSEANVDNRGWYRGAVDVEFTTSEPATIYYTTDGSRPTFESNVVERRGVRDSAAPVRIEESTVLRWFAVDAAGNVEGGYDPDGRGRNYQKVNIRIR